MLSVVKSLGATAANGALQLVYQNSAGVLTDVSAASFQILDSSGTQVFPSTPGNKETINVSGSAHVGTGRYNAAWTPLSGNAVGKWFVRWYYTPVGGSETSFDQEFELVTLAYKGPNYCTIYDLRDEGLTSTVLADADAQKLIVKASRYAELFTGRKFSPEFKTIELDGRGGRALLLIDPVIAIQKISVAYIGPFASDTPEIDLDNVRIYNRHITENLTNPDDRDNPKIEWLHGDDLLGFDTEVRSAFSDGIFPKGVRNIKLTGFFGYTEYDGSFVGQTPELLREVCKMLSFKYRTKMSASSFSAGSNQIVSETTRDQSVTYSDRGSSAFTGDVAVDTLLAGFRRPPIFGAV